MLPSRRVKNEEADLSNLIDGALLLAKEVIWVVDQPGESAALLLALLWEHDQKALYVPSLSVDRARDADVIADQAWMRPDLGELHPLLARRRDLLADQSTIITRLREALLSPFLRLWT